MSFRHVEHRRDRSRRYGRLSNAAASFLHPTPHVPQSPVPPTTALPETLTFPDPLSLEFEGWRPEAFAILERLREHPHIEQYREEKPAIAEHITGPFKRYRDDLAVNWVLPNGLPFETEKNVFARLLKNDFGAGGCHHHLWMSFYRPPRRRLTDAQLSHSIRPDGFDVGCYVGDHAKDLLGNLKARIEREPDRVLEAINPLLETGAWRFYFYAGTGTTKATQTFAEVLEALPDGVRKARGIWLRRLIPRERVLEAGPHVVGDALAGMAAVWPFYRLIVDPIETL